MKPLNTTRSGRDCAISIFDSCGGDRDEMNYAELCADCNALEDELARVRDINARKISAICDEITEQRKWKETAYTERAKLIALLTRLYPSHVAQHDSSDASWDQEWLTIIFVQLPTGQASWHIHLNDIPLFDHLPDGENNWDGHTTDEKYQRVLAVRADKLREEVKSARRVFAKMEDAARFFFFDTTHLLDSMKEHKTRFGGRE